MFCSSLSPVANLFVCHFKPNFSPYNAERRSPIRINIAAVIMSRLGRQTKKDSAAEDSAALASSAATITVESMADLLERHRASLAADFKSSFASLEAKLDKVQVEVAGHGRRITDLESSAEEVSQHLQQLEATCSALQDDNKWLKSKLSDLEGRSRRQNIGIVGLPESVECPRPTAFFYQLLVDVLGEQTLPSPPGAEQSPPQPCAQTWPTRPSASCHHTLPPISDEGLGDARGK